MLAPYAIRGAELVGAKDRRGSAAARRFYVVLYALGGNAGLHRVPLRVDLRRGAR